MTLSAMARIYDERNRQKVVEGWTSEHDDRHDDGEIMQAGSCYFMSGLGRDPALRDDGAPLGWPWDASWWKPKDRERDLVRAGALFQAEVERLTRRQLYSGHAQYKLTLAVLALERLTMKATTP